MGLELGIHPNSLESDQELLDRGAPHAVILAEKDFAAPTDPATTG